MLKKIFLCVLCDEALFLGYWTKFACSGIILNVHKWPQDDPIVDHKNEVFLSPRRSPRTTSVKSSTPRALNAGMVPRTGLPCPPPPRLATRPPPTRVPSGRETLWHGHRVMRAAEAWGRSSDLLDKPWPWGPEPRGRIRPRSTRRWPYGSGTVWVFR